ncbi:MAG: polysaccharide biosynthesis C-terminal domain-containing protein [Paraglaciecola sp.]|nr:polysaccharide biosynthesis C-terminal domain-containing protein [Paraglaciecola sp.]
MLASCIAFAVNILGNYILVPTLGSKGAAISTAVSFWIFLVLRTEFASRVWRPLPRVWLYFSSLSCLCGAVGFSLYGSQFPTFFTILWLMIIFLVIFLYRKEMFVFYSFIQSQRK